MADPYPDIERNKTPLGTKICPSCGRANPWRMNQANKVYWVCKWPTGDEGSKCGSERRLSVKETTEFMHHFRQDKLKMKGPQDEPANDNKKPAAKSGGVYDFYAE